MTGAGFFVWRVASALNRWRYAFVLWIDRAIARGEYRWDRAALRRQYGRREVGK